MVTLSSDHVQNSPNSITIFQSHVYVKNEPTGLASLPSVVSELGTEDENNTEATEIHHEELGIGVDVVDGITIAAASV